MMRTGTFSSSQMYRLMTNNKKNDGFGVPALKYIKQVNLELRLGRALMCERDSHPTSWGNFCEDRVFNLLDLSYRNVTDIRFFHPTVPYWSGKPDLIRAETVCDCKSPFNLEVFCDKIEALAKGIDSYREQFPEDYWQHISNAILLIENGMDITHFEAIIYIPYRSEIEEIRSHNDGWIKFAQDDELPWLPDGGHYKNLNKFRFQIPEEDKKALENRVKLAGEKLIQPKLMLV